MTTLTARVTDVHSSTRFLRVAATFVVLEATLEVIRHFLDSGASAGVGTTVLGGLAVGSIFGRI